MTCNLTFSETSTIHAGLHVEVWSKNIILDRPLGFQFIPLDSLPYNQCNYPSGYEQWFSVDAEQIIINGDVQGTRDPTGHMILLDLHFELPFGKVRSEINQVACHLSLASFHMTFKDVDTEGDPLQDKMVYNNVDYSNQYIENCDFQSDFNCQSNPPYSSNYGQLPQATPDYQEAGSLETSRQNSYEKDERQYYDVNNYYNRQYQEYSPTYNNGEINDCEYDDGALFYNSRPMR